MLVGALLDPRLRARIRGSWPLAGVRSGSGLVWRSTRLLVVQDDVPAVALLEPATRRVESLVLEGGGRALEKAAKPDFEAAVQRDDGAIYVLGSGSAPTRRRIARIGPDDGVRIFDAGALYDAVSSAIDGTPNVEGAVILGDVLRLFHRGAGGRPSASLDVGVSCLDGAALSCGSARLYDLGRIGGVPLTITDATPWPGGRMLYLAVAEDTPDALADGPIAGGAVGVLEGDSARYAPLLEADGAPSLRKAEGVAMDAGAPTGWLITDPDDPMRPAELCRLELEGPW